MVKKPHTFISFDTSKKHINMIRFGKNWRLKEERVYHGSMQSLEQAIADLREPRPVFLSKFRYRFTMPSEMSFSNTTPDRVTVYAKLIPAENDEKVRVILQGQRYVKTPLLGIGFMVAGLVGAWSRGFSDAVVWVIPCMLPLAFLFFRYINMAEQEVVINELSRRLSLYKIKR